VNWPGATAFLDILVDDSLQLFFFNVIKHNIRINCYLTRRPTSTALNRTSLSCSIPKSDLAVG
jgi:hypothetical protein